MCLILENQSQASGDKQTSVMLCLMIDEDQHHTKRADYPPELELTIKLHSAEGKPMAIDFPINELKRKLKEKNFSDTEVLKKSTTRFQGPLTGKVNLHYICQHCNAQSNFSPTDVL